LALTALASALPPLGTAWTLSGKVGVYKAHPEVYLVGLFESWEVFDFCYRNILFQKICPVFGKPTLEFNGTVVPQPVYEPVCKHHIDCELFVLF
jgi:hypothetical protein